MYYIIFVGYGGLLLTYLTVVHDHGIESHCGHLCVYDKNICPRGTGFTSWHPLPEIILAFCPQ